MAQFFIDRPIFAWVIAIIIMLAGALAITELPVSQYPAIAPPQISITGNFPGASAKTVEDTVTQVIEQKMNGIDHLTYMASNSDSFGNLSIALTFDPGTDPNIAQVQVQNKLQLAIPLLPQAVQERGLQVNKSAYNFLMVAGFISENGGMNRYDLADYVATNVQDTISRVQGVGELLMFGSPYAMRIWLDPNKLHSFGLTTADVKAAIRTQNSQVSAGQLGGTPSLEGQQLVATITSQTLLNTPEDFDNVVLRTNKDGSTIHLRDVARTELGSENYDVIVDFNSKPAVGMAIKLATGANALSTADAVKDKMNELARFFPAGMQVVYPYDTTPFIRLSIREVVKTLLIAISLVFLVMFLFLQNFRATLIPTIAVPVVLLGTFAVLAACGFSINTLTMFAMVLAIGLLVDDAIVVVENVERIMSEEGLPPREATRKSMKQITGALVGIALVLAAVFVPMAFFGGSTGVIYRQFSITIVSAMILSVLVALILTPALCATLLKPVARGHKAAEHGWFSGFFRWFNRGFDRSSRSYRSAVARMLGRTWRYLLIYAVLVAIMAALFLRLPTAFFPDEDMGTLYTMVQLPVGASQERTLGVLQKVQKYYLEEQPEAVEAVLTISGYSHAGRGQNMGLSFIRLKDWKERRRPDLSVQSVAAKARVAFTRIRDALVFPFPPPPVRELGNATGFDLMLQDRAGLGHEELMAARSQLLALAAKDPLLNGVRPNGQFDNPEFKLDIDREKAGALGLSLADINETLSTAWGGTYVNDFLDRGRTKKVYLQADAPFRMLPEDIDKWYVRNRTGELVPFSAFASAHWTYGSPRLERYNGLPSMEILGQPAPGTSTGLAMAEMEKLVSQLPAGIGYQWTGLSFQERLSGSQAPALYAISLLVVFLCLAALYESWAVPFSVMLVVPLGVLGALTAATLRGLPNDIYFQVGLLTTIGLSSKNAILIVEFAKEQMEHGMGLIEATLEGVRVRLRPILMTSLAFMLGVLPLVVSSGAGSGAQHAIGTGVFGGMFSATVLAIFFVPLFFVVVRRLFPVKEKKAAQALAPSKTATEVN